MKLVSLESIDNSIATLRDIKVSNQTYKVELDNTEKETYQEMLNEAKEYEYPNEETGVLIFYDEVKNKLTINNNSNFKI